MERLRFLREKRGLSQQDLADLIGSTQPTIHKYETGANQPDIQTLGLLNGKQMKADHRPGCYQTWPESLDAQWMISSRTMNRRAHKKKPTLMSGRREVMAWHK